MRIRKACVAVFASFLFVWMAAGAAAQVVPAPATEGAENPLDQLGWMVGKWVAVEKTPDGSPLVVEVVGRWAEHKRALLFSVRFTTADGKVIPQYEGLYIWHPGKKKLVLWQVNRHGDVAEGELAVNGKQIEQSVHVYRMDGTSQFLLARYDRQTDDAFSFKAYFRNSETEPWKDALDLVYRRQRDPGPANQPQG